jgi:hypothetical protein
MCDAVTVIPLQRQCETLVPAFRQATPSVAELATFSFPGGCLKSAIIAHTSELMSVFRPSGGCKFVHAVSFPVRKAAPHRSPFCRVDAVQTMHTQVELTGRMLVKQLIFSLWKKPGTQ